MKRRKPNNPRARMERSMRAVLGTNHVSVINIDPVGGQSRQGMIHLRNCKNISPGRRLADAVCDIPHAWVIYVAAFCIAPDGERYIKSQEVALQGLYLASHLTEVIETYYRQIVDSCNRRHLVGSGWIANPCGESLEEEQAARLFEAAGAWNIQLPSVREQECAA